MKDKSRACCVVLLLLSFWPSGQGQKGGTLRLFSHFIKGFVRHQQQWSAQ